MNDLKIEEKKLFFKLLDKAINFLSYRARSEKEVSDRLDLYIKDEKLSEDRAVEFKVQLLRELKDVNLLDDATFAKQYVIEKTTSKKPSNKRSIVNFLYKKGIKKEVIEEALNEYPSDLDVVSAQRLVEKKLKSLRGLDAYSAKRKLMAYLYSKGYDSDVIYTVVDTKINLK